jgi:hypothetical protein
MMASSTKPEREGEDIKKPRTRRNKKQKEKDKEKAKRKEEGKGETRHKNFKSMVFLEDKIGLKNLSN